MVYNPWFFKQIETSTAPRSGTNWSSQWIPKGDLEILFFCLPRDSFQAIFMEVLTATYKWCIYICVCIYICIYIVQPSTIIKQHHQPTIIYRVYIYIQVKAKMIK